MPIAAPAGLCAEHDAAQFDCGEPALDEWLKQRAVRNESRFSRTYVICDQRRIAGYVCIAAGSLERSAAPGKVRRNAPDVVPVAVIGRLAVDRAYAGRGLGSDLLSDALRRIAAASRTLGGAAALVHAKDADAKRFYLSRAEFMEYPADSRILFLPIETLIASLA